MGSGSLRKGAILGVVQPIEKHALRVSAAVYVAKGIIQVSLTARQRDCSAAADWSVSHYIVPVKNPSPAMQPFISVFDYL